MEPTPATERPVLEVSGLTTHFYMREGDSVAAVEGVSFKLGKGEILGIVGESGCGKSVTALSILRLIPPRLGRVVGGSVHYEGQNLLDLSDAEMRRIRGNEISMIFQEPMTALNPVLSIGYQIVETLVLHQNLDRDAARERAIEMLRMVQIPEPARRFVAYPHELSGGMRQRVMIAMALACTPKVLIADEPTTALDVTVQAQILELVLDLRELTGTSIVMITHDLGVIAETADRVAVMYAGRIVEEADVETLFARPMHPYTRGLLKAIPRADTPRAGQGGVLHAIDGVVPALSELPRGCAFAPRCPEATDYCASQKPPLEARAQDHQVACWNSPREAGT